jgi:non-specific serine/threonine protein kinase/serine/threonine-protein kinase
MSSERWQQLEDVFHRALDCRVHDRPAFVAEACGADAALRQEVERLLYAHEHASRFVEQAAADVARVAATVPADERQIGVYRIVRELGRGGMGTVYLGERADAQFQMRVAIKVIKRGMDSDAVLQRFRHERQILACLEHPNIARLLDGGTTAEGVPYFVMEYVDGQRIDEYCRSHRLPILDRLDLFRQVCSAVVYAHQNLVVHRDIKPSNILVTSDRVPKLLDFGIAKLLDPDGGDLTLATELGRQAMTPQYASPEQLRGDRVTTVSDVYALGVLLYELLVDTRPYEVTDKSADEARQIVVDTEVVKPSAMASRGGDPGTSRRLRGDLDTIVVTALRKDPAERYASVALLADDVRRHIEGLPVVARGDSWTYRMGRFVRRHKVGVAAAAAIVISLIGGVIATSWQARVARAERARAERRINDVRKLANSVLFDYHDAIESLPGATAVRERLVTDAVAYLDSLAREAGGDPGLQRELAAAYTRVGSVLGKPYTANLGNVKGAMESYEKALRIREALVAEDPRNPQNRRELAESHRDIGWQWLGGNETDVAREQFRQAIALYGLLIVEHSDDDTTRLGLARTYNQLGSVLEGQGDLSGALENERRALPLLTDLYARSPNDVEIRRTLSITYDYIGRALFQRGEIPAALESNGKALELRAALAREDPTNATFRRMLAISYQNDGDFRDQSGDSDGAIASFRRKLPIDEALLAADPANVQAHGDLAYSFQRLADLLAARGAHAEALPYYRRAAVEFRPATPAENPHAALRSAMSYAGLARAQAMLGDRPAALDAVRRARTIVAGTPVDPLNPGARWGEAEAYRYMAEAYVALATRQGLARAVERSDRSAACELFQRSHDVWNDMLRRGILNGVDAAKPDELARALDRCQAMLRDARDSGTP